MLTIESDIKPTKHAQRCAVCKQTLGKGQRRIRVSVAWHPQVAYCSGCFHTMFSTLLVTLLKEHILTTKDMDEATEKAITEILTS